MWHKRKLWGVYNFCLSVIRGSLFNCWFLFCFGTDGGSDDFFACTTFFSLWVAANGMVIKIQSQILLNCHCYCHYYFGNCLQFCYFQFKFCFSICAFFSAKTDPAFCVDFSFWNELEEDSCTFSSRVSFSRRWAIYPLICFFNWNWPLFAHYQTLDRSWQQKFHRIGTWRVYRDSPYVDLWNRVGPVSLATLHPYPPKKWIICNCLRCTSRHRGVQCSTFWPENSFGM